MISKYFKRTFALVLCLAVLFVCSACGADNTKDASTASSEVVSSDKPESKVSSTAPVSSKEAEKPVVNIMPLGDSLTQGGDYKTGDNPELVKSSSSYRSYLSTMLKEGGYNTKFVGSHNWAASAITDGNVMHSGYGGATIFSLRDRLKEMKDANPDIILLMIGRNDITQGTNPSNYIEFLDKYLIADLNTMFPDAHIFVASIPAVLDRDDNTLNMNADDNYAPKIIEYVEQKKGAGAKIDFVDMRVSATGLTAEDFTVEDFVHPQPAGYEKIAKQWYASITDKIEEIAEAKSAA